MSACKQEPEVKASGFCHFEGLKHNIKRKGRWSELYGKEHFASSNSGRGFNSYFNEVFEEADRLYIIKGGPGTGKSSLMKRIAEEGEKRGAEVRRIYCSSDPRSLDGIIIYLKDKRVALADGTAPHIMEPELPGAREKLINLGEFWDDAVLYRQRDKIEKLNMLKSRCYDRAYKWLSGALDMCEVIKDISSRVVDRQGVDALAASIVSPVGSGEGFCMHTAVISAIGGAGLDRKDSLYESAKRKILIRDRYMTAHLLLESIVREARVKGLDITVSRDPIDADRIDAVLIPSASLSVTVSERDAEAGDEVIFMSENMNEIGGEEENGMIRAERCRSSMISAATAALAEASSYHLELERIYSACMDFSALDKLSAELCLEIFGE